MYVEGISLPWLLKGGIYTEKNSKTLKIEVIIGIFFLSLILRVLKEN